MASNHPPRSIDPLIIALSGIFVSYGFQEHLSVAHRICGVIEIPPISYLIYFLFNKNALENFKWYPGAYSAFCRMPLSISSSRKLIVGTERLFPFRTASNKSGLSVFHLISKLLKSHKQGGGGGTLSRDNADNGEN